MTRPGPPSVMAVMDLGLNECQDGSSPPPPPAPPPNAQLCRPHSRTGRALCFSSSSPQAAEGGQAFWAPLAQTGEFQHFPYTQPFGGPKDPCILRSHFSCFLLQLFFAATLKHVQGFFYCLFFFQENVVLYNKKKVFFSTLK